MASAGAKHPSKGIKYVSFHEKSGYGIAAKQYMLGFVRNNVELTWTPMIRGGKWGLGYEPFPGCQVGDALLDQCCNRQIDYDTVVVHTVPEYFPLWAEREPGKRIVGYTVWETDRIPRHWLPLLNGVDLLAVPCDWNRKVFQRCGVTVPIEPIPHIARCIPDRLDNSGQGRADDTFVFYTIGDWTNRKTIWKTLECYWNTFSSADPVVLEIKTSKRDFTQTGIRRFFVDTHSAIAKIKRRYVRPARLRVITEVVSDAEIDYLHQRGNCYVSLCRSEGWGLGAFDAACAGNPVIMTGFGGQLEYLPEHLAYRVDYTLTPTQDRPGRKSYSPDQCWAEPDLDHASRLMRSVLEDRNRARDRGQALRRYVHANFNEEVVIKRFMDAIANGCKEA